LKLIEEVQIRGQKPHKFQLLTLIYKYYGAKLVLFVNTIEVEDVSCSLTIRTTHQGKELPLSRDKISEIHN
jgi:hypothetical protein